jgi:hypothetical protein
MGLLLPESCMKFHEGFINLLVQNSGIKPPD